MTGPDRGEKRARGPGLAAAALAAVILGGCAIGGLEDAVTPGAGFSGPTNTPVPAFAKAREGSEEDFILNVGRRTYFAANSAELDSTARQTLDAQAAWLVRHPGWYAKLQGHADDGGGDRKLSQRRAEAVMAYLVSRGVEPERLWAKGYGRERLVRDCPALTCKAQNRRVVTNLREEIEDWVIARRRAGAARQALR